MKVLVIRFSSIGDIVLTTPVVRSLKLQTGAEVHFAVKHRYRALLLSNPYITKVHSLDDDLNQLRNILRSENFDYAIDLHHNLRTRVLLAPLGIKTFRFNKLNIEKWLIVNFKINILSALHIVDRYMATVAPIGIEDDNGGLDFFIPEADEIKPDSLPVTHQNGFVAYAIGGQHATKKLPVDRMIELCVKIDQPIVLLGGSEDVANGERVRQFCEQDRRHHANTFIFNACGLYSINQAASILKMSTHVFSHDTGMMHIAAAFKKQIFAIWGNTIPAFGMYPYRTQFQNLENNNLPCRPCSKIGYSQCPQKHFKCMKELKLDFDV